MKASVASCPDTLRPNPMACSRAFLSSSASLRSASRRSVPFSCAPRRSAPRRDAPWRLPKRRSASRRLAHPSGPYLGWLFADQPLGGLHRVGLYAPDRRRTACSSGMIASRSTIKSSARAERGVPSSTAGNISTGARMRCESLCYAINS